MNRTTSIYSLSVYTAEDPAKTVDLLGKQFGKKLTGKSTEANRVTVSWRASNDETALVNAAGALLGALDEWTGCEITTGFGAHKRVVYP